MYVKSLEGWNVNAYRKFGEVEAKKMNMKPDQKVHVTKIVVRDSLGRFHGSTNFKER